MKNKIAKKNPKLAKRQKAKKAKNQKKSKKLGIREYEVQIQH